uniref:Ovule protein n=1 Tax=Parascaris equorum TaxID=6256 RepID=A0A914RFF9_PAREQ
MNNFTRSVTLYAKVRNLAITFTHNNYAFIYSPLINVSFLSLSEKQRKYGSNERNIWYLECEMRAKESEWKRLLRAVWC